MKIRCYLCGKTVPSEEAKRREMTTEQVQGIFGNGIMLSGMPTGGFGTGKFSTTRLVDLCLNCNKTQDEIEFPSVTGYDSRPFTLEPAHMIGLGILGAMVIFMIIGLVLSR